MIKLYRFIVVCVLGLAIFPVAAQQHKTVLPYRMVGGKMIVDMEMEGVIRPFIFDTGASRTSLTGEFCKELGATVKDSLTVTDANGHKASYPLVSVKCTRTLDKKFEFRNIGAMKLPEPSPFACFGVAGLVGSDILAGFIVEIDGKANTITLCSAEKEPKVSLRRMVNFAKKGMPIISLSAGPGNSVTCLFDTGSPGFLSLKESDYEALQSTSAFHVVAEGVSIGAMSIGGVAGVRNLHRVCFPVLSVGVAKFRNVTSETSTSPYTLLGVKLLDYGKVTLDYARGRFYFEGYNESEDLTRKSQNVGLQVKDGDLVVAAIYADMRGEVEMGDKVVKINGKPVGKYDFCKAIINGLPELKAKKKTKLTIQTREGEKVIVY